jgi:hypothetical protein
MRKSHLSEDFSVFLKPGFLVAVGLVLACTAAIGAAAWFGLDHVP